MGKPLKEVSKKGEENAKFLKKEVEIVLSSPGKEPTTTRYTVDSLVRAFVDQSKEFQTLQRFVADMTLSFYQTAPQDPFFIKQGPAFVDFVKSALDDQKMKQDLARVEAALKAAPAAEGAKIEINGSCVDEKPANAIEFPAPAEA